MEKTPFAVFHQT
ncbi:Protein of unknown function [Bacillus cereus]|nr:Protein of unknown function [Bacillus cereus]